MNGFSSPTKLRPGMVQYSGFSGISNPYLDHSYGNTQGNAKRPAKNLGIFEERRAFGSSWLAGLSSKGRRDDALNTSKASSLWQNFHLFEAPRKRGLTSPDAPTSMLKFCFLCAIWYSTSAMSSNTGKAILMQFRYPVTLTFVQFGFVAGYCLLFMSPLIGFTRLRKPTRAILESTIPMGVFQVGGHMFSSMAISRIPVSTVHTIKVRVIVLF